MVVPGVTWGGQSGSQTDWLRAIVDSWEGTVYVVTPDYRIAFMNRLLIDRLGRDGSGANCFRVLYDRSEPCPWCAREVFRGETVRNRLQQPADGRWYQLLHTPLPLADGSFGKIVYIRENPESPALAEELPVFQLLVDRLRDAVFFHDPGTGRLLYVNDTACQNLGYSREDLLRMHVWDYSQTIPSAEHWRQLIARLEEAGEVTLETRHRHRNGTSLDLEIKATAVQVSSQRYILSVARDITERKQAEARLREERNKVAAIMAAIGDGITVQNREFRILYQNETQIARQGVHLGEYCYRAYQNRDSVCDGCQVAKSFADGRMHRRQTVTQTAQGPIHLEVTACPLRDSAGEVVACVEVIRDISEQKRMERALLESSEKYRLLFSAGSDAILTYDAHSGTIEEVNDTACAVYRRERAAFVGCRWAELLVEAGDQREGERQPALHRRGDGSVFPVEFSAGTFHWQGRAMVVAVVRDISERLRLEQSREEVFSVISHEMRTPLTAILGFAEYLAENDAGGDPRREIAQLIVKESERMWRLIDNLLSLKRLLAGFGLEDRAPLALLPLLQDAVANLRVSSRPIVIDCAADLPCVLGDAATIQQALDNLLGNAVKYSPPDSRIVLGARTAAPQVLLWVRDEGPGIAAAEQERIFERFYRVGGRKGPAGTGLGLALVREIAHAHGGRAWVESTPGGGSTFYMSLPLAP